MTEQATTKTIPTTLQMIASKYRVAMERVQKLDYVVEFAPVMIECKNHQPDLFAEFEQEVPRPIRPAYPVLLQDKFEFAHSPISPGESFCAGQCPECGEVYVVTLATKRGRR